MRNIFSICFFVVLLAMVASFAVADDLAAVEFVGTALQVNDGAITSGEVIADLGPEVVKWANNLTRQEFYAKASEIVSRVTGFHIRDLLLHQHAKKEIEKIDNYQAILESALAEQRKNILLAYDGSAARAQADLAKRGTTIDDQLDNYKKNMIIRSYWDIKFSTASSITRMQMLRYYKAHRDEKYYYKPLIQFQLIDIQIDPAGSRSLAEQSANDALVELNQGVDFAAVVQKYSHGFRKSADGLWRPIDPGSLQKQYQPLLDALKTVQVGQHTGIVESSDRFFIAKLIDRQEGRFVPFSEAQSEIEEILLGQLQKQHEIKMTHILVDQAIIDDASLEVFIEVTTLAAYDRLRASIGSAAAN